MVVSNFEMMCKIISQCRVPEAATYSASAVYVSIGWY